MNSYAIAALIAIGVYAGLEAKKGVLAAARKIDHAVIHIVKRPPKVSQ